MSLMVPALQMHIAKLALHRTIFQRYQAVSFAGHSIGQIRTGHQRSDGAGMLGLNVPPALIARADEVIE